MSKKSQATWSFLKEFVHAPSSVGSVCPSSKALAASLIKAARVDEPGMIIDLGAGTGIVTEELLLAGVPKERIMAIELSPGFTNVFAQRCPTVPLIIDDARNLGDIVSRHATHHKVAAIISSLPLRVLPGHVVQDIMDEVRGVLSKKGGVFIQYTYAVWMQYPLAQYGLKSCASSYVVKNLPPAKVESYMV